MNRPEMNPINHLYVQIKRQATAQPPIEIFPVSDVKFFPKINMRDS